MPEPPVPLTRRSLLVVGLGGAVLATAGCDPLDGVGDGDDGQGASAGTATPPPSRDHDKDLLDQVGAAVAGAAALARAVGAAHPRLSPVARQLVRLHEAHLDRLSWSGPSVGTPKQAPTARSLRASESTLQATLAAAAQRAASGALAQTFASMAAAVAQHRTVLA